MKILDIEDAARQVARSCGPARIEAIGNHRKLVFEWEEQTPRENACLEILGSYEGVVDYILHTLEWFTPSTSWFVLLQTPIVSYPSVLRGLLHPAGVVTGDHIGLSLTGVALDIADQLSVDELNVDVTNQLIASVAASIADRHVFSIVAGGSTDFVYHENERLVFHSPSSQRIIAAKELALRFES